MHWVSEYNVYEPPPLKVRLSGESLFMNWGLSRFPRLAQGEIPIPDVEKSILWGVAILMGSCRAGQCIQIKCLSFLR